MKTTTKRQAYRKLQEIIERHGGVMEHKRQGYRFGAWEISLDGKRAIFEGTGARILPALDRFYVADVPNPKTWDDYSRDELVDGAEQQLLALLK
jgi:hypothetical protein